MIFWKKVNKIGISRPTISFKINLAKRLDKFPRLIVIFNEGLCKDHKKNL